MTDIIGAGLSGLIAATQFPLASVYEASARESVGHKALLRFRSDTVSRLTGIPFRRVVVRKSIYSDGHHCLPSIAIANKYSIKTNGMCLDRSIWNVDPVERFIAPEDFIPQLIEQVGPRITWNHKYEIAPAGSIFAQPAGRCATPVISTIPMMQMVGIAGVEVDGQQDFNYSPIHVSRYRISNCDVFQTIYYPDPDSSIYRASISGNLLIVESMALLEDWVIGMVLESFGIGGFRAKVNQIGNDHSQRFGKITAIDDYWRRKFIYDLTIHKNIYSLGRFATWRNILLDDVADDVAVIKRLIAHGQYGATLQHTHRS